MNVYENALEKYNKDILWEYTDKHDYEEIQKRLAR